MQLNLSKKLMLAGSMFVGGWVGFHVLTDLKPTDVVLAENYQRGVHGQLILAGDVVALTPGTRQVENLCRMDATRNEIMTENTYVNGLALTLPRCQRAVSWVRNLMAEEAPATEQPLAPPSIQTVSFNGKFVWITKEERPPMHESCATVVAEAIAEDRTVCIVAKAMIETRLVDVDAAEPGGPARLQEETVGLTFHPSPILGPNSADPNRTCSGIAGFGLSEMFRYRLGLVREA